MNKPNRKAGSIKLTQKAIDALNPRWYQAGIGQYAMIRTTDPHLLVAILQSTTESNELAS